MEETNLKCGFHGCKVQNQQEKKPCAGPGCTKLVHLTCFNGIKIKYKDVPDLPGDLVACTKKCAVAASKKDKNGGGDSRRSWDHDAKPPVNKTSTEILMLRVFEFCCGADGVAATR